jgi:hypothetical protein
LALFVCFVVSELLVAAEVALCHTIITNFSKKILQDHPCRLAAIPAALLKSTAASCHHWNQFATAKVKIFQ